MILPQSARKLADSSLGEGAQRECFNRGFVLTKFADSSPGEGAQRECFDGVLRPPSLREVPSLRGGGSLFIL